MANSAKVRAEKQMNKSVIDISRITPPFGKVPNYTKAQSLRHAILWDAATSWSHHGDDRKKICIDLYWRGFDLGCIHCAYSLCEKYIEISQEFGVSEAEIITGLSVTKVVKILEHLSKGIYPLAVKDLDRYFRDFLPKDDLKTLLELNSREDIEVLEILEKYYV